MYRWHAQNATKATPCGPLLTIGAQLPKARKLACLCIMCFEYCACTPQGPLECATTWDIISFPSQPTAGSHFLTPSSMALSLSPRSLHMGSSLDSPIYQSLTEFFLQETSAPTSGGKNTVSAWFRHLSGLKGDSVLSFHTAMVSARGSPANGLPEPPSRLQRSNAHQDTVHYSTDEMTFRSPLLHAVKYHHTPAHYVLGSFNHRNPAHLSRWHWEKPGCRGQGDPVPSIHVLGKFRPHECLFDALQYPVHTAVHRGRETNWRPHQFD